MEIEKHEKKPPVLRDFPLSYNSFNKQKIDVNIEAIVNAVLRTLYTRANVLPSLPNLYVDIERFKHMMDDSMTVAGFQRRMQHSIKDVLPPECHPIITIETDSLSKTITLNLSVEVDNYQYVINMEHIEDPYMIDISFNKKKFYS